jgi:hypothetical protein
MKESEEWYKQQTSKYRKKGDDEYKKLERRAISSGSFITFNYKRPKGIDKPKVLRYFDEYPVNVILNIRGNDALMLNFHYCPQPFRKSVVAYIFKINKMKIKQDKRITLVYQQMKMYIKRNGLEMMIHRYKVNRITNLKYIKTSEIKYVIDLPSEKFVIQDKELTKSELYNMIKSHKSKTRASKNKRYGR